MRIYNAYIKDGIVERILYQGEEMSAKDVGLNQYREKIEGQFGKQDWGTHVFSIPTKSAKDNIYATFKCTNKVDWYDGDLSDKILFYKTYYDFDKKEKRYELIWNGYNLDAGIPVPEGIYARWVGQEYDKDFNPTERVVYFQSYDDPLLVEYLTMLGVEFPLERKQVFRDDIYRVVFNEDMNPIDTTLLGHVEEKMKKIKTQDEICFYAWWTDHVANADETPLTCFKYRGKYPIENQVMEKAFELVETEPGYFKRVQKKTSL